MRINIYSQEITNQAFRVQECSGTGLVYSGIRFMLHSSDRLHYTKDDDDRSGVTFWLPRSDDRREMLAQTFERAAILIRQSPSETGLD